MRNSYSDLESNTEGALIRIDTWYIYAKEEAPKRVSNCLISGVNKNMYLGFNTKE